MDMNTVPTMTPGDFMKILRRRVWSLIIPLAVIFLCAVFIALALPPIYKASTTILIEQQDVPIDFVKATVSTYAEQQMQIINQRIMSSTRLVEIIDRFNLYPEDRKRLMTEEIISKMRGNINLEPISVNVVDPRMGKATPATIAFTLSYEGAKDPEKVLQVANVLASLFLEENVQVRTRQAAEVSNFLSDEMAKVKADLEHIDAGVAKFKQRHVNDLPELMQVNMQSINDIERNIDLLSNQLKQLKEKESALVTQLSSVSPELKETDRQRLAELNVQLVNLKNKFSDEYPDVKKTKAEIADLEKRIRADAAGGVPQRPDNPAYINLSAQLSSTRSEIKSVNDQIIDLNSRRERYKRSLAVTPQVEQEYKALLMERSNTQAKYDDLMRKFMESKVSQGLEKEQKGERFTIIDPARLPEKPYKPNRLAIMLIGLVLGIGAGVGTAAAREYADTSVHSAETLSAGTDFPVLATIPVIVAEQERQHGIKRLVKLAGGLVAFMIAGLIVFHITVMNLAVFWAKLMRWVGI